MQPRAISTSTGALPIKPEDYIMKTILTIAALMLGTAAAADTPNRVTMTFPEFVEASGCIIVDKGGYSNLASKDGGNCPASVVTAFNGVGGFFVDPDGVPNTGDEFYKSDN